MKKIMSNDELSKAIQVCFEMITSEFYDESQAKIIDICDKDLREKIIECLKDLLKEQKFRSEAMTCDTDREVL